jgi:hypothetical protein
MLLEFNSLIILLDLYCDSIIILLFKDLIL